jgi:hypothetical protein
MTIEEKINAAFMISVAALSISVLIVIVGITWILSDRTDRR